MAAPSNRPVVAATLKNTCRSMSSSATPAAAYGAAPWTVPHTAMADVSRFASAAPLTPNRIAAQIRNGKTVYSSPY
jgi:hypothetical protein